MGITWNDNLATGNDVVDGQHKELIRRLDMFIEACDAGKGKEELVTILQFLDDYIHAHFEAEEELQEKMNFAFRASHRKHHEEFIRDFTMLKKRFLLQGSDAGLAVDIRDFVVGWLLNHILEKDMMFSKMKTEAAG